METNDSETEFTETGHCLNDFTVSGKFIRMAKNATLMAVSEMILERARITSELQQVENKLLSCNHPPAVADYGLWCTRRKKDFETELKKLAAKLETKKSELKIELQHIEEQLAQQDIGSEWTVTGDFVSLVPKGRVDPVVALRFAIIVTLC